MLDTRVKASVADYCGKETYEPGDLSKEVDKRVKAGVNAFTGKDDCEHPPERSEPAAELREKAAAAAAAH